MEKGKREGLSDAEKQELQRLFLGVAENDARVLEDMEEQRLNEPCRRQNGSFRAFFETRAAAETFAADPTNWPIYQGDIAHRCGFCGWWHLSKFEWLFPDWDATNNFRC